MVSSRASAALLVLAALALLGVGLRCLLQPGPGAGGCILRLHEYEHEFELDERPEKLDLNEASFKELLRVPGLGPVLAQRILLYRERHGPFRSLDGLLKVEGIGPTLLDSLRAYLTVVTVRVEPSTP